MVSVHSKEYINLKNLIIIYTNGRFETQVSGAYDPGARSQVSGFRYQVSIPGSMFYAPGVSQGSDSFRDHVSDLRDQVPRQNVKNLHIKDTLGLNENYKLLLLLNANYYLTTTFFYFT